jgi:16S rRNA processing protein RimM
MSAFEDMVLVGRIARAFGHRGQVIVNAATDFPEARFAPGAVLHTQRDGRDATLTVTAARMHVRRPVLTLEGVDTMNDAEALAGLDLRVPESELTVLPPGSYYEHDLVGCEVVTRAGAGLGRVRAVESAAGPTRLVIGEGWGEIQVPLVEAICVEIDVAARRIVVDPPEGLVEVNARTKNVAQDRSPAPRKQD